MCDELIVIIIHKSIKSNDWAEIIPLVGVGWKFIQYKHF